jgi:hypothetical protein
MSLLSGVGMTVCMMGLAVYLQLVPNGSETALSNRELSNIPLALLLTYVVCTAPLNIVLITYNTTLRGTPRSGCTGFNSRSARPLS